MCLVFVVVWAIKVGVDGIWLHHDATGEQYMIHLLCLCADADAVAAAADADDNGGAADVSSTPSKDFKDWTTTILYCVRGQAPPH